MLFFAISLVTGVAAVLLAQLADIECVKQEPIVKNFPRVKPAAKRQEERARGVPLAQLVQQ